MSKILRLLIIVAVSQLLLACPDKGGGGSGKSRAVPVNVARVVRQMEKQTLTVIGHVEASATVLVSPQVGGQLMQTFVRSGQYVKAGDKLFQVDQRSFLADVHNAEAALKRDQAELKQAKQDLSRYGQLVKSDFLSRQEYEKSLTTVEALEATIAQDQAVLENARLQLSHTTITAPISGRVGELLVDPGNILKANDQTLLVINTLQPAEVSFAVPERYFPEINRRMREGVVNVLVLPDGDIGPEVDGEIFFADNTVDRDTGSIAMRARCGNTDERLWPGQFVRVTIIMENLENALVIPLSAVLEGMGGQYVYVVNQEDDTVVERPVTTRLIKDGRMLVSSGLAENEEVVTDGQINLFPKARVEVREGREKPEQAGDSGRNGNG